MDDRQWAIARFHSPFQPTTGFQPTSNRWAYSEYFSTGCGIRALVQNEGHGFSALPYWEEIWLPRRAMNKQMKLELKWELFGAGGKKAKE